MQEVTIYGIITFPTAQLTGKFFHSFCTILTPSNGCYDGKVKSLHLSQHSNVTDMAMCKTLMG